MAVTNPPNYADLFHRRILQNVSYWRDFVTAHGEDMAALDGERDGILKALGYALDVADAWPPAYEVMTHYSLHLERRGTWEGWNPLLEQAVRRAEESGDLAAAVNLSTLLARLCQRQSRPAETIRHYRRVISLARRLNDAFSLARACTNLGYLYTEQGRWWRAEILCCAALAIFERIHSDHGRAHAENHLGFLYIRQCLWEQARQRLERACSLWQEMGDSHGLMRGFINQSALYLEREHPDPNEALVFLEKALQQARLTGEEGEIGRISANMAIAYRLKGELLQAEVYSQQAEAVFRRFSDSLELARLWSNRGLIYLDQKEWPKAYSFLKASLEMWRSLHYKYGEVEVLLHLANYDLAREQHQQAAIQLDKLEHLIEVYCEEAQCRPLQLLLRKYRHSLTEDSTKTTEAIATPVVK
ncbi:MAG: tetratricopeptide repeat protein [Anaerolineales bacterium]|nr:tetratricopeptide repeat protein [Anaerolineales bacterium]